MNVAHRPVVLVLGFGPFGDILDNPAARLARSVRGSRVGRARIVGGTMPVSYHRGPKLTLELANAEGAAAVLGIGLARGRADAAIETTGWNNVKGDDVDGQCPGRLDPHGPDQITSSADCESLARALGVGVSDDAGRYVCNAWLYRTTRAVRRRRVPVAFLHIPDQGFARWRLIAGLTATWGARRLPSPTEMRA